MAEILFFSRNTIFSTNLMKQQKQYDLAEMLYLAQILKSSRNAMTQHNSNNLNRKTGKAKWTAERILNMLRVPQMKLLNEKNQQKKSITVTQSQIWTHMETHMHRER